MRGLIGVVIAAAALSAGCNRTPQAQIENTPVGSDVQVTRQDGGLVEGKLAAKDDASLRVESGKTTRLVPRSEVAEVRVKDPEAKAPEVPKLAKFREVTVPASTTLAIKLRSSVSSETNKVEDVVRAELAEPVVVDGEEVIPAGSVLRGEVTEAVPASKVKGRASLGIHFRTITINGADMPIDARFERIAPSERNKDIQKVAIPAAGGAVVGAIIGGKKGAAIGAAAGGGAGAVAVMTSTGAPVHLDAGTVLSLTMGRPVDLRINLK
jgi:hypothetical protein